MKRGMRWWPKSVPNADPIHKMTIIPRGKALGLTQQLPMDERHTQPKSYILSMLAVLMGGRAAEELILKDITTGAGNDIERATDIARRMVCEWGMSEELGPLTFGKKEEQIFLGREIAQHRDYSEQTAQSIDEEVNKLVNGAYRQAKQILSDNIDILNAAGGKPAGKGNAGRFGDRRCHPADTRRSYIQGANRTD